MRAAFEELEPYIVGLALLGAAVAHALPAPIGLVGLGLMLLYNLRIMRRHGVADRAGAGGP